MENTAQTIPQETLGEKKDNCRQYLQSYQKKDQMTQRDFIKLYWLPRTRRIYKAMKALTSQPGHILAILKKKTHP